MTLEAKLGDKDGQFKGIVCSTDLSEAISQMTQVVTRAIKMEQHYVRNDAVNGS